MSVILLPLNAVKRNSEKEFKKGMVAGREELNRISLGVSGPEGELCVVR